MMHFMLFLIFNSVSAGCNINGCATCNETQDKCLICLQGYDLKNNDTICKEISSQSALSSGEIIGIIIGSISGAVILLFIINCGYRKYCCKNSCSSKQIKEHDYFDKHEPSPYYFGCGEGIHCLEMEAPHWQFSQLRKCEENKYCFNERFSKLNERCMDSRIKNDCDRMAFKLDRKQNLFPDWKELVFTKYSPSCQTIQTNQNNQEQKKQQQRKVKFVSILKIIPFDILNLPQTEQTNEIQLQPIKLIDNNTTSPQEEGQGNPIHWMSVEEYVNMNKQMRNQKDAQIEQVASAEPVHCQFKVKPIKFNSNNQVKGDVMNNSDSSNESLERSRHLTAQTNTTIATNSDLRSHKLSDDTFDTNNTNSQQEQDLEEKEVNNLKCLSNSQSQQQGLNSEYQQSNFIIADDKQSHQQQEYQQQSCQE